MTPETPTVSSVATEHEKALVQTMHTPDKDAIPFVTVAEDVAVPRALCDEGERITRAMRHRIEELDFVLGLERATGRMTTATGQHIPVFGYKIHFQLDLFEGKPELRSMLEAAPVQKVVALLFGYGFMHTMAKINKGTDHLVLGIWMTESRRGPRALTMEELGLGAPTNG